MTQVQKISPFLWYDQQAREAAEFYTSIFPDSRILTSTPLVTEFTLTGLKFQALNGGWRDELIRPGTDEHGATVIKIAAPGVL